MRTKSVRIIGFYITL